MFSKKKKKGPIDIKLREDQFCCVIEDNAADVKNTYCIMASGDNYYLLYRDGRFLGMPRPFGGPIFPFSTDPTKKGSNRDRKQFQYEGLVNYRFNRLFHGALRSDYYFLDYDNNVSEYAWLYGWSRLQLGLEGGMTLSKWTDLLVSANYQWYWHDDNGDTRKQSAQGTASRRGKYVRGDSKGWSVMGGVATHMTEKLQYRVLAGWSRFEYGGGVSNLDGWTYQGSADWQIDAANTFHVMALASSYYQPSEREFGSALLVHNASFGVAKSFIRNKLKATADVAFRSETHEYTEYEADNYDENIWTARLTLSYRINRLFTVYGRVEYQTEESDGYYVRGNVYDYDRWRCTIGLRMTW